MKFLSPLDIDGYVSLLTQNPGVTPTKFLVQDSQGRIAFRTGQELKVDIGADYTSVLKHQVKASVAINKGQAVYAIPTQDGTNILVGLASNNSEATSSKTMGLLNATVVINGFADVITEGLLSGLNTSTATAGDPVWLGTNGNLIYGLVNKPYAPSHLVFIGIVTRVNTNNGEIFVKVQNGFELDELHDVDLKTTTPINGHILGFNGTLWVNKTVAGWLGYTPQAQLNGTGFVKASGTTITYDNTSYYPSSNPNGYISSYTETDPTVPSHVKSITTTEKSNWNTAYGWGNHALAGYVPSTRTITINGTGYDLSANRSWTITAVETDTLQTVTNRGQTTTNSIYAPNYYDNNNTAYYLDPAGNSNLYYASFANDVQMNGNYLRFDQSGTRSWNIRAASGNLNFNSGDGGGTYVFNGASSFLGNASWFGGYGSGSGPGLAFENQSTFARIVFWGLDFYDWNHGTQMAIDNGYVSANNSFRAPIFYDSNNTGYYVDPASTSQLNYVAGNRIYAGADAGVDGSISTNNWFRSVGATGWYNQTYSGGWYMADTSYVRSYNDLPVYTGSYFLAGGSHRAPVFYDSNDTSYFVDLNSTGKSGKYAGFLETYASANKAVLVGNWNGANYWGFGSNGTHTMQIDMVNADSSTFLGASDINLKLGTNTVWHTGNASRAGNSNLFYYQGFTLDANTMDSNSSGFTYANNAPFYGPVARFSTGGGYDLWLGGTYNAGGYNFYGRTRDGDAGVYNAWRRFWTNGDSTISATGDFRAPIFYDSDNTGYYVNPNGTSRMAYINADELRSYSNLYLDSDYGRTVVGTYSSYRFQGVFSMGSSWMLPADGTSPGNLYGLSWSHPNAGGQASYLNNHGLLVMVNGYTQAALTGRGWFRDDIMAPVFYDSNDSSYYLDPTSTGLALRLNGNIEVYARSASWAEGIRVRVPSASTWGGYRVTRDRGNNDGNWYFGYTALDSSDDFVFGTNNNGNQINNVLRLGKDGNLYAQGDITAYYSDERLKDKKGNIENALEKVLSLNGFYYEPNEKAQSLGYQKKLEVGVSAQEVEAILPEIIKDAPIGHGYKTLNYGKLTPLLIEAIKEQQTQIEELKQLVNQLINK